MKTDFRMAQVRYALEPSLSDEDRKHVRSSVSGRKLERSSSRRVMSLNQLDTLLTEAGATAYELGEQDDKVTHVITRTQHTGTSQILQDRLDTREAVLCTVSRRCSY
jgi:hypothetical protein